MTSTRGFYKKVNLISSQTVLERLAVTSTDYNPDIILRVVKLGEDGVRVS